MSHCSTAARASPASISAIRALRPKFNLMVCRDDNLRTPWDAPGHTEVHTVDQTQVMQRVAAGRASSRSSLIGSPHVSHTP